MGKSIASSIKAAASKNNTPTVGSIKTRMAIQSVAASEKPVATSRGQGVWTKQIRYNPEKREMVILFSSGFIAVYPDITQQMINRAIHGLRTISYNPNRNGSTGAWLHKNPSIMHNYRQGTMDDLTGAPEVIEDDTYGTSTVYEEDGSVLFDMNS